MSHAYSMKRGREGEGAGNVAENHIAFGDHGAMQLVSLPPKLSTRIDHDIPCNVLISFFSILILYLNIYLTRNYCFAVR